MVALGGALAVCTRNFVNFGASTGNVGLDMGLVVGSFAGAVLVSLIAIKAVHWFHAPNHVITVPCVIPMIPGVLMYRFLLGFISLRPESMDNVLPLLRALDNGINSALVILFISVGVAIPNIFARRYIAADRERKLQILIEERRQRGKFVDLAKLGA